MTPGRWQHIDRLFHSTLEQPPEERAAFLKQACSGNADLHDEVESLLVAHERDEGFLEAPAYEMAPEFVVESLAGLVAGQQIGPYKILSALAIGGMGEVYLAYDTRLGRKIALKLLTSDFARDQNCIHRFTQEARAASALSHPNVCVIYEIGQTTDGRQFIAMEHIEGITLRDRIAQGPLPLSEALVVAEQIGSALAAAHAAGVVHRDIKPENIMLHRDGYVKVLDFGLAKLNESVSGQKTGSGSTAGYVHTEPGIQMGTVRYMSPEQLRERPVDERADIWSFGVVLHEMVTGVTTFDAPSRNEVIAAILRKPPKFAFLDSVPVEYQRIVARALSKNRRDRYQTATALIDELKRLRLEISGKTEGLFPSAHDVIDPRRREARPKKLSRRASPADTTALWPTALSYVTRTAGHLVTGFKEHPGMSLAGLAVVLTVAFALSSRWFVKLPQKTAHFQNIKMTSLTNAGRSVCAVISPDGKVFAHAEMKDGLQELLLTNIATEATSVVVPASNLKYRGIVFSRDTNYLYLTTGERNESGVLYQVALPAGIPKRIMQAVDSPIAFSPAGDRFSFVRFDRSRGDYSLVIAGGGEERTIATRSNGDRLSPYGPAWSPDGQVIACGVGHWGNGYQMKLMGFTVQNGQEFPIGQQEWSLLSQVAWLENTNELIVAAKERWTSPYQLWRIRYPEGESFRITTDTSDYERVSVSQDGNSMVVLRNQQLAKMWVAPDGDTQHARALISNVGVTYGMDWTSKGRIVFSSMTGNNLNISAIDPDGTHQALLTVNAGDNCMPAVSGDGRFVVFTSNRSGAFNIWRMNADDGSDPVQLTFGDGNFYPSCSPDGQWISYENQSAPVATIYRLPFAGGEPALINSHARMPVVSPDGSLIAYRNYLENGQAEIAVMRSAGGPAINRLPIPIMDWQRLQWMPDGRGLTYIKTTDGVSNIWMYGLDSGHEKQLTQFASDLVFAYAWSPDFKQLACLRGTEVRDVTMISNQK